MTYHVKDLIIDKVSFGHTYVSKNKLCKKITKNISYRPDF